MKGRSGSPLRVLGAPPKIWFKLLLLGGAYVALRWTPGAMWVPVLAKLAFNAGALGRWRRFARSRCAAAPG